MAGASAAIQTEGPALQYSITPKHSTDIYSRPAYANQIGDE
jgi:hypothetical protein